MRHAWLAVLLFALLPRAAAAFDRDFHYAWTYYLALQVGYTERQAYQVASGAQSVDNSPHTDPMSVATAWDMLAGADSPDANPHVGRIWRDAHCFAERAKEDQGLIRTRRAIPTIGAFLDRVGLVVNTDGEVAKARFDGSLRLRDLARREGNPGPLLHYEQDCFSHFDFNERMGHAVVGHAPDWMSTDPDRTWEATIKTLDQLAWFRRAVLREEVRKPDLGRTREVLQGMIDVNPRSELGLDDTLWRHQPSSHAGLVHTSYQVSWGPIIATVGSRVLSERFASLDTSNPDVGAAIEVIAAAVEEDREAGRLAHEVPGEPSASPPFHNLVYLYDSRGHLRAAPDDQTIGSSSQRAETFGLMERYVVEQPEVTALAPSVAVARDETSEALWQVDTVLSYRLGGIAEGLGSLPVRETCAWSDTPHFARALERDRDNGVHALSSTVYRTAEAINAGLTRTCVVEAYGEDPVTLVVDVPPVAAEPEPADQGADAWLAGVAERVAGARARALAAAAAQRSACEATSAAIDEATARLDTAGAALDAAEEGIGRVRAVARLLPGAKGRIETRSADAWTAGLQAADANDRLREQGLGACLRAERALEATGGERMALVSEAEALLREAGASARAVVRHAATAREHADVARSVADEVATASGDLQEALDAARGAGTLEPGGAPSALAEADAHTSDLLRARNSVHGEAFEALARWRDGAIEHTSPNREALAALIAAWKELDEVAGGAGACVEPLRAPVGDLETRSAGLQERGEAVRAEASSLARATPDPALVLELDGLARDAEATASSAELFAEAAPPLVEQARQCLVPPDPASAGTAEPEPTPEPRPEPAPTPPPTPTGTNPDCRNTMGPTDVVDCWCFEDEGVRKGRQGECAPLPRGDAEDCAWESTGMADREGIVLKRCRCDGRLVADANCRDGGSSGSGEVGPLCEWKTHGLWGIPLEQPECWCLEVVEMEQERADPSRCAHLAR